MKNQTSLVLAAVAALGLPVATTNAQWLANPVNGTFNNPANWTGGVLPAPGTAAPFSLNSSITTITVDAARQSGLNITANASSFTFNGGSFQLASGQGITTSNTVTADQTVNTGLFVFSRNTSSANTMTASGINNSKLIINGNFAGGQNVAGLSGSFSLRGTGYGVMNGVISDGTFGGNIAVQKTGGAAQSGTWELNGANTYTGGTELGSGSGSVILGNKAAFGTGQVRIVNGFSSLSANTSLTGANAIANTINYVSGGVGTSTTVDANVTFVAGTNTGTLNSGAAPAVGDFVVIGTGNGNNFLPYYTRVTGVSGSTITFSENAIASGASTTLTTQAYSNGGGGTTTITGSNDIEFSGVQNLSTAWSTGAAASQVFNVTNTGLTTFSGVLQQQAGVASVAKSGAGTLALSGANTYTGGTTINAGTLLVNNASGSGTGTGAVTVNAGGTLGGTGIISGAVTVNAGATFAPGASAGLLTLGSSLAFSSINSLANFEVATGTRGVGYDAVNVTGLLTYNGDLTLTMTSVIANGTYDLFGGAAGGALNQTGNFDTIAFAGGAYAGTFVNGGAGVWTAISGGQTFTFTQSSGDLTVIPEPGTAALVTGGVLCAMFAVRRRKTVMAS